MLWAGVRNHKCLLILISAIQCLLAIHPVYLVIQWNQVVILDSTSEEKDLGVLFTSNLKVDHHISAIVCKSNSITGIV